MRGISEVVFFLNSCAISIEITAFIEWPNLSDADAVAPGITKTDMVAAGYVDEESNTYISGYAFDRVIDPSEVEAVLFRKDNANGNNETEEPEYYEVAVK